MIKIALDMMGGDNAPSSNIVGAIDFLNSNDEEDVKLYLVGSKEKIKSQLLIEDVIQIFLTQIILMKNKFRNLF